MNKLVLWGLAVLAALLVMAPAASGGAASILANSASPGIYFTVTGKATGGRDYFAIAVQCDSGYGTRIFVTTQDGAGTSQTIYPPAGSCTAELQAAQSINKFRTLETITFIVT
jgi:hypothetical protein